MQKSKKLSIESTKSLYSHQQKMYWGLGQLETQEEREKNEVRSLAQLIKLHVKHMSKIFNHYHWVINFCLGLICHVISLLHPEHLDTIHTSISIIHRSFTILQEGGIRGIQKPQNCTEICQKTANRIRFFPKYRNHMYIETHYTS